MRTRPALHENETEAEAGCYEVESEDENLGLDGKLASRSI